MGVSPKKVIHHRRPANWPNHSTPESSEPPWHPHLTTTQVHALVARCAQRKLRIFGSFHEYEKEDLIQIGFKAVLEGWKGYKPNKSAPATFVYTLAWRRIRDEHRSRSRRAKHEGQAAAVDMDGKKITQPEEPEEPQIVAVELLDLNDGESLPDWLSRVYMACKLAYKAAEANQKTRRGRKWFSPAQCAAAALLMVRSKLTTRGAQELFKDRPELCRALRFMHAPSQMFFVRSGKFVSRKLKDFSAMQERYFEGQKVESGEAA